MPLEHLTAPDLRDRRLIQSWFYAGVLFGRPLADEFERFDVNYVVAVTGTESVEGVQSTGGTLVGERRQLLRLDPDAFTPRLGEPELVTGGAAPAWALGADEREEVTANSMLVNIPPEAEVEQLHVTLRLAPSATAVEDSQARVVATLERFEANAAVGEAIHAVADVFIEAGTEAGASIVRTRSPIADFEPGVTYRLRVWRDGGHEIDTYPGDVWLASADVGWAPDGPLLASPVYQLYSVD